MGFSTSSVGNATFARQAVKPSAFGYASNPLETSAITIQFTPPKDAPTVKATEAQEKDFEALRKAAKAAQTYKPQNAKEKGIYNRYMALQSGTIEHKEAKTLLGRELSPESYSVNVEKLAKTMNVKEPTLGQIKEYFALEDGDIRWSNDELFTPKSKFDNFDTQTPSEYGLKKVTIPNFRMNRAIKVVENNEHGQRYTNEEPELRRELYTK